MIYKEESGMKKYIIGLLLVIFTAGAISYGMAGNFIDTIENATENGIVDKDFKSAPVNTRVAVASPSTKAVDDGRFQKELNANFSEVHALTELSAAPPLLIQKGEPAVVPPLLIQRGEPAVSIPTPPKVSLPTPPAPVYVQTVATETITATSLLNRLRGYGLKIVGGLIGQGPANKGYLWTVDQLAYLVKVVQTLPALFRFCTLDFQRVASFAGSSSILGYVYAGTPRVFLTNRGVSNPTYFSETVVHEMAHCWYYTAKNTGVRAVWEKTFWPAGNVPISKSVSSYGCTNRYEDFAESVRLYWENGDYMKSHFPDRYKFIKDNVFGGFVFPMGNQTTFSKF
jgi:hypothetical protein